MSSLIEAILKNQFKQVSLAVSLTLSGEKLSGKKKNQQPRNSYILSGNKLLFIPGLKLYSLSIQQEINKPGNMFAFQLSCAAVRAEYTARGNYTFHLALSNIAEAEVKHSKLISDLLL